MSNFRDLIAVDGQRFIDRFSGDALRSWWSVDSGTASMSDVVNQGLSISATNPTHGVIDFAEKRAFDFNGCNCVFRFKQNETTNNRMFGGFKNGAGTATADSVMVRSDVNNNANIGVFSQNGASSTTNGSVAVDTSFHEVKLSQFDTYETLIVDGSFDVFKTTDMPTAVLQPTLMVITLAGGTYTNFFNYYEAWNH